ncbi:MAG: alpha-glucuronidase [Treponema sp.]|nr:alpha-glucuronidase [Treponema sp.]MCL2236676.1 alpha-glucuronidase [Treponema sp.]
MLKEYDCWLQERKVTAKIKVPEVIYAQKGGEVCATAVRELSSGINRLLGFVPKVQKKADLKNSGVFLEFDSYLKPESFSISITENQILICAADDNGLLYGVFRFLFLLAQGKITHGLQINETPASPLRMINHWDNFDGTIERGYAGGSLFYKDGNFDFDNKRIEDYARLLASTGINRLSINNVNVRANAKLLITEKYLREAAKLAAIFRRYGIRLFISINFGAPWSLGKLETADPLDERVFAWWKERASIIYKYIPDLAGFLVKADSEGEPGPFQYERTHADGANMLAKAVKPFGGEIVWRCFVYNCQQDWRDHSFDRARAAYDHFMPLDGAFLENVILQIKFGPYDFQVREPVTPLFGALLKTRHVMELQITQEYTGHQIDLCFLPHVWQDIARFDIVNNENTERKFRIMDLIGKYKEGLSNIEGFASVVNVGLDNNWTGHTLAQANLYGYGRLTWNPQLSAKEIAQEWCALSFGEGETAKKIEDILLNSYPAYEKYNAPFGVCFMVTPNSHYGPNIEGYEFSRWGTYHRADANAIGIDRTPSGTGYTEQYSNENAAIFRDASRCPENLILFFHRLRYDFKMKNGNTLLQNIYDTHFEGYDETFKMAEDWKSLKDSLQKEVYESVLSRFEMQLINAKEWRDQINTYFFRKTGIPDNKNRKIFP